MAAVAESAALFERQVAVRMETLALLVAARWAPRVGLSSMYIDCQGEARRYAKMEVGADDYKSCHAGTY